MGGYKLLSLWRYPVKSMAGEELEAVEVTARGLNGDRAYALVPRADLAHDPGILRAAAQQNRLDRGEYGRLPCVGVYADVVQPGRIRRGDPVRLVD